MKSFRKAFSKLDKIVHQTDQVFQVNLFFTRVFIELVFLQTGYFVSRTRNASV